MIGCVGAADMRTASINLFIKFEGHDATGCRSRQNDCNTGTFTRPTRIFVDRRLARKHGMQNARERIPMSDNDIVDHSLASVIG